MLLTLRLKKITEGLLLPQMSLLSIQDLWGFFRGLVALHGVSMDVEEGRIFSIIGPNGAGKTTIFNCISGIYKPTKGKVIFRNREITGKSLITPPAWESPEHFRTSNFLVISPPLITCFSEDIST